MVFFTVACSVTEQEEVNSLDEPKKLEMLEVAELIILQGDSGLSMENGVTLLHGTPYTGWVHRYERDTILISKTGYYKGLQQDTMFKYHPTGEIAEKRLYHKGKKHGIHEGWYPDGSVSFRYEFIHGLTEGVQKKWRASGRLAFVRNYKDGKMLGLQQGWLPDGKIRCNYYIKESGKKYGLLGVNDCVSVQEDIKRNEAK